MQTRRRRDVRDGTLGRPWKTCRLLSPHITPLGSLSPSRPRSEVSQKVLGSDIVLLQTLFALQACLASGTILLQTVFATDCVLCRPCSLQSVFSAEFAAHGDRPQSMPAGGPVRRWSCSAQDLFTTGLIHHRPYSSRTMSRRRVPCPRSSSRSHATAGMTGRSAIRSGQPARTGATAWHGGQASVQGRSALLIRFVLLLFRVIL